MVDIVDFGPRKEVRPPAELPKDPILVLADALDRIAGITKQLAENVVLLEQHAARNTADLSLIAGVVRELAAALNGSRQ